MSATPTPGTASADDRPTRSPTRPATIARLERDAAGSLVLASGYGLAIAEETPIFFAIALVFFVLQRRAGEHPALGSTAFRLGSLSGAAVAAVMILLGRDFVLTLADFLLVIQGLLVIGPGGARDRRTAAAISLVLISLVVVLVPGLLVLTIILFQLVTLIRWLSLRRLRRLADRRPGEGAGRLLDPRTEARLHGGARRTALVVALVAGLIFLILPRTRSHLLALPRRSSAHLTGFTPEVSLDDLGRIRLDTTVVLRARVVRGPNPPVAYFRGAVFDRYLDGVWQQATRRWLGRLEPARDQRTFQIGRGAEASHRLEFRLESAESVAVFQAGPTERVTFGNVAPQSLLFSVHGGLRTPSRIRRRLTYTTESWWQRPWPAERGRRRRAILARCLAIPRSLDRARFQGLAEQLRAAEGVAESDDEEARIAAIAKGLKSHCRYTLDIAASPGVEPIQHFLFESRSGHCELFASSLVFLLRADGIPARLVNGFLSDEYSEWSGSWVVRRSHAHAWVEALVPGVGWIRIDATPARQGSAGGERSAWRGALDWLEASWTRYVEDFGGSEQRAVSRAIARRLAALFGDPEPDPLDPESGKQASATPPGAALWLLVALVLPILAVLLYRRRRSARAPRDGTGLAALDGLLDDLERAGFRRGPGETLNELAARIVSERPELKDLEELAGELTRRRFAADTAGARRLPGPLGDRLRRLRRRIPAPSKPAPGRGARAPGTAPDGASPRPGPGSIS